MKRHIHSVHEDRKDHKCESCNKSFSQAGDLKRHYHIVHEGHKDHKCEYCVKSFSCSSNLNKHIHKIHGGNKYSNSKIHTKSKKNHKRSKKEEIIIQSNAESLDIRNEIKNEEQELDEMPIFESDSTYLDKEIKEEIIPQSIMYFQDRGKTAESQDEIKNEALELGGKAFTS